MTTLASRKCGPCSGKTAPLAADGVRDMLREVPEWKLNADGKRISRNWRVRDFSTGLDFFRRIEDVALFTARAAHEHVAHALGCVLGAGTGALRRFVVGMRVDLEQTQVVGHPVTVPRRDYCARRSTESVVAPIPRSRLVPRDRQENSGSSARASRRPSAASTVPGRARPVMRLARLTTGP